MLTAIRHVTHPDGVCVSSYKYLPSAWHITLMAFIMKHVKVSDDAHLIHQQNKLITTKFDLLTKFIPGINKLELLELLEDFCNRTLTTEQKDQQGNIINFEATTFISAYTYNPLTQKVTIELSYRLIPFILYIKQQYIGGRWKYSASFTSSYSTLIYDIIVTQLDKKSSSLNFSLSEMKLALGIAEDTYKIYSNFKRKVLNIAINEINHKSDLYLELIEHKKNRKVIALEFKYTKNQVKGVPYAK